jgi:lipoprotein signal peptidase
MTALVVGMLAVPALDHLVKELVRARLGGRSVALGALGRIQVVPGRLWLHRAAPGGSRTAMWGLWGVAAGVLAAVCALAPSLGWAAGLLLGGALSHAVETSRRGVVHDFVCLRFWPAFDLADVALAVGALGMVAGTVTALSR